LVAQISTGVGAGLVAMKMDKREFFFKQNAVNFSVDAVFKGD